MLKWNFRFHFFLNYRTNFHISALVQEFLLLPAHFIAMSYFLFSEFSLTQFFYMLNVIFNVWSSILALHKNIKLKLYILYAYIIKWVLLELQCCLYLDAAVDADDHIVKLSAGIGQQSRQQQWHPCCFANLQILVKCRQLGCGIIASFQFGLMN